MMARALNESLIDLLGDAGYRIEGPGGSGEGVLVGRYWWTLIREGWSGVECGEALPSYAEAQADAVEALLADEDLDWEHRTVSEHAMDQFPPRFASRMASLVMT